MLRQQFCLIAHLLLAISPLPMTTVFRSTKTLLPGDTQAPHQHHMSH